MNVSSQFKYLRDHGDSTQLKSIQDLPSAAWKHLPHGRLAFGPTNDTIWLRGYLKLPPNGSQKEKHYLEIAYPQLDSVTFYIADPEQGVRRLDSGIEKRVRTGAFILPNPHIPIEFGSQTEPITVYIKIHSRNASISAPLILSTEEGHRTYERSRHLFFGLIYGILFIIFMYSVSLYFYTRDRRFLYYIVYILPVLTYSHIGLYYLNLILPDFARQAYIENRILTMQFQYLFIPFMNRLLNVFPGSQSKGYDLYIPLVIGVLTSAIYFFNPALYIISLNLVLLLMYTLYTIIAGVEILHKNRMSYYAFPALLILSAGISLRVFMLNGLISITPLAWWGAIVGGTIEHVILSFAMGDSIRAMVMEKDRFRENLFQLREEIYSDLHDHLGSQVTDLQIALNKCDDSQTVRSDALSDFKSRVQNLSVSLRSHLNRMEEIYGLEEDFLSNLHLILLRRYANAGRQLSFHYTEEANEILSRSDLHHVRKALLPVCQEVSTNDLKYGSGHSTWDFQVSGKRLNVSFTASTTYRISTGGNGHHIIGSRLKSLNGIYKSRLKDNAFLMHASIPLSMNRKKNT